MKSIVALELQEAAEPLMQYLAENCNPHVIAIVSATGIEMLEGIASVQNIMKYIKD